MFIASAPSGGHMEIPKRLMHSQVIHLSSIYPSAHFSPLYLTIASAFVLSFRVYLEDMADAREDDEDDEDVAAAELKTDNKVNSDDII